MSNPAMRSRIAKEKNPRDWCSDPRCLWHVSRSGPCPKHPVAPLIELEDCQVDDLASDYDEYMYGEASA